ncbi:2-hydroxychromene-2-carboxylate isomerase [Niveibacterium umoris]|uniref:2-hydroxychromene-2-carboxylate isomerase n=1 Tax=Niveibacterium umoris TaxID=1193620 RepID=A0A840BN23_9RHOO|nr:2-hydroxychromene-2-carboxylate isomerase [Niveibacterium umoris]MBB4013954.1 2-hydroxychromene-2-carboxylate isomerase [Niveibacterium umoris]
MPAPIDFYFDFSSPYGYLAAEVIDTIASKHGRAVIWHPILLGAAFKAMGAVPLPNVPLKGEYVLRDVARSARFLGLPFKRPTHFPIPTQNAARAFLWLNDRNTTKARELARALYRAYFVEDINISEADTVLDIAAGLGIARVELSDAISTGAIKERLKAEVDVALARGVFGSPFFIVEGEPFWGVDRLPQIEKWLSEGAF